MEWGPFKGIQGSWFDRKGEILPSAYRSKRWPHRAVWGRSCPIAPIKMCNFSSFVILGFINKCLCSVNLNIENNHLLCVWCLFWLLQLKHSAVDFSLATITKYKFVRFVIQLQVYAIRKKWSKQYTLFVKDTSAKNGHSYSTTSNTLLWIITCLFNFCHTEVHIFRMRSLFGCYLTSCSCNVIREWKQWFVCANYRVCLSAFVW